MYNVYTEENFMLKCKQCGYESDDNSVYPLNIKICPVCGKNLTCVYSDLANSLSDVYFYKIYLNKFGKEGFLDTENFLTEYNNTFENRVTANKAYNAILPTQAFKDVLFASDEDIDNVVKKSIKTLELEGISKIWSKAIFEWLKEAMYGKTKKSHGNKTSLSTSGNSNSSCKSVKEDADINDTHQNDNVVRKDEDPINSVNGANVGKTDRVDIAKGIDSSSASDGEDKSMQQCRDADMTIEKAFYYYDHGEYKKAFEIAKYLSDSNVKQSFMLLAVCCYYGRGTEQDYVKAVELYNKAVESGNIRAYINLGNCYYNGYGVELNYKKAVELFNKALEAGDSMAYNSLGICYYEGRGVEKNYVKAVELYKKAIELGETVAYNNLGNCDYHGYGVEKNYAKAVELYNKAIQAGGTVANCNLGNCYYYGNGVEKNISKAVELFEKSTENNNFEHFDKLASYYENKNENIKALRYYICAYNNNAYLNEHNYKILKHVSYVFDKLTGKVYSNTMGEDYIFTPIENTLKELANENNALAQYYLNYLRTHFDYEYNLGRIGKIYNLSKTQNVTEYFDKALKNNFIYALYFSGQVEKSAEKGYPAAIKELADKYYDDKNYEKAYAFYQNIYNRAYLSDTDKLNKFQIYRYINTIFMFNKGEQLLQMLEPFVKEKDVFACTVLARYYFQGRDGISKDYAKAFACLKDLDLDFSYKGNFDTIYAAYILGFCYQNGYGCEKNMKKACSFFDNAGYYKEQFNFEYDTTKQPVFVKDNKTNLEIKLYKSIIIIQNGTTSEYKRYHIDSIEITNTLLKKQAVITTYLDKRYVFKDKNIVELLKNFKELNGIK